LSPAAHLPNTPANHCHSSLSSATSPILATLLDSLLTHPQSGRWPVLNASPIDHGSKRNGDKTRDD
jgi:hypothetical protein